jgi:hypothetical protein
MCLAESLSIKAHKSKKIKLFKSKIKRGKKTVVISAAEGSNE